MRLVEGETFLPKLFRLNVFEDITKKIFSLLQEFLISGNSLDKFLDFYFWMGHTEGKVSFRANRQSFYHTLS